MFRMYVCISLRVYVRFYVVVVTSIEVRAVVKYATAMYADLINYASVMVENSFQII